MLAKKNRLNLRLKQNLDIFKNSKRNYSKNFIAYFRENNQGYLKLSIVVPKKIVIKAVKRNYFRRLLYNNFPKSFLMNNFDLVVVMRKKEFESKEDLTTEFNNLIKKCLN